MRVRKAAGTALAGVFAVVVAGLASQAAGDFQGTWQVKDSQGKPFEITLSADGKASGTQRPNMSGSWQEQGSAAVVTWNTGWTTKIEKTDGRYTHSAWRQGQSSNTQPTATSDAQKLK